MKGQAMALPAAQGRVGDYVALAKPRLNVLVVATAGVGYYLGSLTVLDPVRFATTVIGTALVAAGASALNQVYERRVDSLMERTRLRPLPDGRIQPAEASVFGLVLSTLGLLLLAFGVNLLSSFVALATLVIYVGIYTPLKQRTSFATVVGAVPGALPPVIGWAGATGAITHEAWLLFGIVFLWQMPHFLAIAWLYREDYAAAGFPMLPVIEPDGRSTARQVTAYGAALVPVSLAPAMVGLTTPTYFVGALVLGLAFLGLALRFAWRRPQTDARWLFLGSIIYLPLIWTFMVAARA
jgi:heme o synthase